MVLCICGRSGRAAWVCSRRGDVVCVAGGDGDDVEDGDVEGGAGAVEAVSSGYMLPPSPSCCVLLMWRGLRSPEGGG